MRRVKQFDKGNNMKHLIAALLLVTSTAALSNHPLADESRPLVHELVTIYSDRFKVFIIPDSNLDEVMAKVNASVKVLVGVYGTCSTFYNVARGVVNAQNNKLGLTNVAIVLLELEAQMHAHVQMFVTAYVHIFPGVINGSDFLHEYDKSLISELEAHREKYMANDEVYWDRITADCRQVSHLLEIMDALAVVRIESRYK